MSESTVSLRGKTVAVHTRGKPNGPPIVLKECMLETRGQRLFLVGVGVPTYANMTEWTDNVRRAVAWDAIEDYLLFDSPDDYHSRVKLASPTLQMNTADMPTFVAPSGPEGIPVEPSGIQIEPETPLSPGAIVLSYSQGRWWRAEVVALEGEDLVRIHYPGWDESWDTTVPRSELQVYLGESLEAEDSFE
jgi:hypothetical protein